MDGVGLGDFLGNFWEINLLEILEISGRVRELKLIRIYTIQILEY